MITSENQELVNVLRAISHALSEIRGSDGYGGLPYIQQQNLNRAIDSFAVMVGDPESTNAANQRAAQEAWQKDQSSRRAISMLEEMEDFKTR